MRKRGPSGGGTLRRESPQQGQRPSSLNARVASARSQWPRASHSGLMHCTVKPGKYCMSFSLSGRTAFCGERPVARPEFPWDGWMLARIVAQARRGVKNNHHNILGYTCSGAARSR